MKLETQKLRRLTIWICVSIAIFLGAYDVFVYVKGGAESTISVVIWDTASDWPIFTLACGILIGHWFWQNKCQVCEAKKKGAET